MKYATTLAALALIIGGCSTDSAKTADSATAATADTSAPTTAMGDSAAMGTGGTPAAPAPNASAGGWIDPNSASANDLASIPGITDNIAASIVSGRPYANMTAIDKVLAKTLTEQQRDSVYTRVWIPIDLNKATAEEIMLIPGVGPRMRHEFEEYRPYTSIEQFRREIGKYVDKAEVARLERYVKI